MKDLLKASVEALRQLRAEMHGKLEGRAIDRIDEIIRDLENLVVSLGFLDEMPG